MTTPELTPDLSLDGLMSIEKQHSAFGSMRKALDEARGLRVSLEKPKIFPETSRHAHLEFGLSSEERGRPLGEPLFSFMTFDWTIDGDGHSPWAPANSPDPEMEGTLAFLRKASDAISGPSPSCRIYRKAVRDGKIKNYIGTSFKGGETGSRPGETGSRPGETGSRPSELILPCFQFSARP